MSVVLIWISMEYDIILKNPFILKLQKSISFKLTWMTNHMVNFKQVQNSIQWTIFCFFHVPWSAVLYYFFIFERERERERDRLSVSGGGAEREGDAESKVGSRPWAVSTEPDRGFEPMIRGMMSCSQTIDWATQVPLVCCTLKLSSFNLATSLGDFEGEKVRNTNLMNFA